MFHKVALMEMHSLMVPEAGSLKSEGGTATLPPEALVGTPLPVSPSRQWLSVFGAGGRLTPTSAHMVSSPTPFSVSSVSASKLPLSLSYRDTQDCI